MKLNRSNNFLVPVKLCISSSRKLPAVYNQYYTVSQKNDTGVAHYNFNADQPILIIFGRDVAERVRYQMVIYYPTSPN